MSAGPASHGLWAITSYFNPIGYRTRLANYRAFRRRLEAPLVTVEMGLDGRFELSPDDATILVQVPSSSLMWQKERLLNLALRALPAECRSVAWLDCDILFERDDWAERASAALEDAMLVQPYSRMCALPRGADLSRPLAAQSYVCRPSLGAAWAEGQTGANHLGPSAAALQASGFSASHANGHAWAIRRDAIEPLGFYDSMILGSGDYALVQAALGRFDTVRESRQMTPRHYEHYARWARRFRAVVQGRLGVVSGDIYHLWHGELPDRQYMPRHRILAEHDFDPYEDIAVDQHRCWQWTSAKPALHRAVRAYFEARREDGRPEPAPPV